MQTTSVGALPADRIRGGVILTYFALVNNTASLWSVPLASAMYFPSGDQPKSQMAPEVKWVNCFVGALRIGPLQRLGVPERMSNEAKERPSGVQRRA